jgi:hypothetical protein
VKAPVYFLDVEAIVGFAVAAPSDAHVIYDLRPVGHDGHRSSSEDVQNLKLVGRVRLCQYHDGLGICPYTVPDGQPVLIRFDHVGEDITRVLQKLSNELCNRSVNAASNMVRVVVSQ